MPIGKIIPIKPMIGIHHFPCDCECSVHGTKGIVEKESPLQTEWSCTFCNANMIIKIKSDRNSLISINW